MLTLIYIALLVILTDRMILGMLDSSGRPHPNLQPSVDVDENEDPERWDGMA